MSAIRALKLSTRAVSTRQLSRASTLSSSLLRMPLVAVPQRAFSVSARVAGQGTSDVTLVEKLATEISYEKEAVVTGTPEFLQALKDEGIWKIEETAGQDEISLTRTFGNETIKLIFSIADLQNAEPDEVEEHEESGEEGEAEESEPMQNYPIRVNASITKAGAPGALVLDTVVQEGGFIIENISFYNDAKLGTDVTAEADWQRRGLYIGPEFETLDPAVQEEFDQFIAERGLNEKLALFIPEYCEFKEQNEYVKWLNSVSKFIQA
ncbi:mitochondrial glycoprotein [Flagelloscypha sp. PMI_526]|nr:mitochondrial glycoprotein [Flagelloscypha sp. PMI_526]